MRLRLRSICIWLLWTLLTHKQELAPLWLLLYRWLLAAQIEGLIRFAIIIFIIINDIIVIVAHCYLNWYSWNIVRYVLFPPRCHGGPFLAFINRSILLHINLLILSLLPPTASIVGFKLQLGTLVWLRAAGRRHTKFRPRVLLLLLLHLLLVCLYELHFLFCQFKYDYAVNIYWKINL